MRGGGRAHVKIHGYVSAVTLDRWWATLLVDDHEVQAEMVLPLPEDRRGEGFLFTAHRTKRGDTYLFWPPPTHVGSARRKQINRRARDRARMLADLP